MHDAERRQRKQEIVNKVKADQERFGHDSSLPAFVNLFVDHIVDTEEYLADLREEIATLRKTFVEHKHHLGSESHSQVMRRLDKAIKDVEQRLGRQGMSEVIDG